MKLTSMTDKVIELNAIKYISYDDLWYKTFNYATFLKLPIKLEYFVCSDKSKVLFEGFEVYYRDSETIIISDKKDNLIEFKENGDIYVLDEYLVSTIEEALFFFERDDQELTITPSAIKQFNL